MLVHMRKAAGTWVMAIFSFLIIISFAVWGIGDIFRGRTTNSVATVADVEISSDALSREFRREMNQLQTVFGGNLDVDRARDLGLVERALDSLVTRALFELEAARMGLAISDDLVRQSIIANTRFHNAQDQFDPNIFASTLATSGMTEDLYVALLRGDLTRTQLVGSMTAGATPPDFLVDAIYRFREQRRVAEYFRVTGDSVGDVAEPDESTLAAFHEANASQFTAPEYRKLAFLHVAPEDLVDEISVSDEAIQNEYDDRRDSFIEPERRTVDQILLPDEAAANAAYERLLRGGDFIAVATEAPGVSAEDVSLGAITRAEIFDELASTVFDLGVGEISTPIESPFGWHIFRVTDIQPEAVRPLSDVRDALARDVALRDAVDALYQLTNTLDDTLAGGATLEQAAGQLDLRIDRIDAVDATGKTPEGLPATGLPEAPEFLPTAFATLANETSLLTETSDGNFFVVRVDAVVPPVLRPLDTIRDEVADAWRAGEREKAAAERAQKAVDRVDDGEDFAAIAAELGQRPKRSAPVRRDGEGADETFSPALVGSLFAIDVGATTTARAGGGAGHVVVRLAEIVEADPAGDAAGVQAVREMLAAGVAGDLTQQYRQSLQARFPVSVNRGAVNALF